VWQEYDGDNHPGIDYDDAPNTTVRASANGVVILADACSAANCVNQEGQTGPAYNGGYGNVILVEYPYNSLPAAVRGDLNLQENQSLYMLYPHLRDAPALQAGDIVRSGQVIGNVGSTGNSSGPHLHFETRTGTTGSLNFGDTD
jgi:murein DD-endopeptidase MepM/ murein hydrolase activator NlpD